LTKLSADGSALIFSTYLGGNGRDEGLALALDPAGNVLVTGSTTQLPLTTNDFPVVNAFQPAYGGARANAFVAKLNRAGSQLIFSTYMGGQSASLQDVALAIKSDRAGHAYVTGRTETFPDMFTGIRFPIVHAFQPEHGGGVSDAFLTRLTPEGALVYSSYLGGSGWDSGNGLAVSASGRVYLTGSTSSADFQILDAYQPKPGGGNYCELGSCFDAFMTMVTTSNPLPELAVSRQGATAAISWSAAGMEFALESTADLTAPVSWRMEAASTVGTGTRKQVIVPLTDGSRFYRLRAR
jgi:hypothetical protein